MSEEGKTTPVDSNEKLAAKPEALKSSYYHFSATPKDLAEEYKPKAIIRAGEEPTETDASKPKATGPSSWNKAGTWEEQNITDWAHKYLKTVFVGTRPDANEAPEDLDVSITEIDEVDGDVDVVWIRGKKALQFELTMTLKWEGTYKGEEVEGEVKISDLDGNSMDDFEIRITTNGGSSALSARDSLRSHFPDVIRNQFRKFYTETLAVDHH